MRQDPLAALLSRPLAPGRSPGAVELAESLLAERRLRRPATAQEGGTLRAAAALNGHPWTMRLVDVALCDAAIRWMLHKDEARIHAHLKEFRHIAAGHWEADAILLLDCPANAPPGVRLRHLPIRAGRASLTLEQLHYHAVRRLAGRLPPALPATAMGKPDPGVMRALAAIQRAEEERRAEPGPLADIPSDYPPCVRAWLASLKSGVHLRHFARFNLMAFLGRLGWDPRRLTDLFAGRPDYDAREIAAQANHVPRQPGRQGYAPMGCDKLRSLGLCPDAACPGPSPLSLYASNRRRAEGVSLRNRQPPPR